MERVKQSYIREIITSVLGILILIVLIFVPETSSSCLSSNAFFKSVRNLF